MLKLHRQIELTLCQSDYPLTNLSIMQNDFKSGRCQEFRTLAANIRQLEDLITAASVLQKVVINYGDVRYNTQDWTFRLFFAEDY